jgi:hypothetical protein
MGKIAIALSGKPFFVWNGDEAAVKNILEAFPRGARGVGLTPEEFATPIDRFTVERRPGLPRNANDGRNLAHP